MGETRISEEAVNDQRLVVNALEMLIQRPEWKKFVELVEAHLESSMRALIAARDADDVRRLQGAINGINWALDIPAKEFDKLKQMEAALASTTQEPE